jgi:plasmid stabilization system protein ParE
VAQVVWTEPALSDLEAIADYIALDNPQAASELIRRAFAHVGQLAAHPESGRRPPELKRSRYRELVEPPCRIFYRNDRTKVFILYVMRTERLLRPGALRSRETP